MGKKKHETEGVDRTNEYEIRMRPVATPRAQTQARYTQQNDTGEEQVSD